MLFDAGALRDEEIERGGELERAVLVEAREHVELAVVHLLAADVGPALDDQRREASLRGLVGDDGSAGARADHADIDLFTHHDGPPREQPPRRARGRSAKGTKPVAASAEGCE